MRGVLIIALVAVIAVVLGVTFLLSIPVDIGGHFSTTTTSISTTSTGSSTTSTSISTTTTSSNSGHNLQLRLALNVSNIFHGTSASVRVEEYNTAVTSNNVSVENLWKVGGLSLGTCGREIYPFGIAVFRGNYADDNVSQGKPLQIYPVTVCPMLIRLVTGYLFEPLSDLAVIIPSGEGAMPVQMEANITLAGEYTFSGSNSIPNPFSPGTYTVVAGDEWGSLIIIHFIVGQEKNTSTTTTVTTITSSSTSTRVNGTLNVQINIGPTQPVCMANSTVGPAPATFDSIKLVISTTSPGSNKNITVPLRWLTNGCEAFTSVQVSLPSGTYLLNLSACSFLGCKSSLPKNFVIVSNQITNVSVSIDTGIR